MAKAFGPHRCATAHYIVAIVCITFLEGFCGWFGRYLIWQVDHRTLNDAVWVSFRLNSLLTSLETVIDATEPGQSLERSLEAMIGHSKGLGRMAATMRPEHRGPLKHSATGIHLVQYSLASNKPIELFAHHLLITTIVSSPCFLNYQPHSFSSHSVPYYSSFPWSPPSACTSSRPHSTHLSTPPIIEKSTRRPYVSFLTFFSAKGNKYS